MTTTRFNTLAEIRKLIAQQQIDACRINLKSKDYNLASDCAQQALPYYEEMVDKEKTLEAQSYILVCAYFSTIESEKIEDWLKLAEQVKACVDNNQLAPAPREEGEALPDLEELIEKANIPQLLLRLQMIIEEQSNTRANATIENLTNNEDADSLINLGNFFLSTAEKNKKILFSILCAIKTVLTKKYQQTESLSCKQMQDEYGKFDSISARLYALLVETGKTELNTYQKDLQNMRLDFLSSLAHLLYDRYKTLKENVWIAIERANEINELKELILFFLAEMKKIALTFFPPGFDSNKINWENQDASMILTGLYFIGLFCFMRTTLATSATEHEHYTSVAIKYFYIYDSSTAIKASAEQAHLVSLYLDKLLSFPGNAPVEFWADKTMHEMEKAKTKKNFAAVISSAKALLDRGLQTVTLQKRYDPAYLFLSKARAERELERIDDAIQTCKSALFFFPTYFPAYYQLINLLVIKLGNLSQHDLEFAFLEADLKNLRQNYLRHAIPDITSDTLKRFDAAIAGDTQEYIYLKKSFLNTLNGLQAFANYMYLHLFMPFELLRCDVNVLYDIAENLIQDKITPPPHFYKQDYIKDLLLAAANKGFALADFRLGSLFEETSEAEEIKFHYERAGVKGFIRAYYALLAWYRQSYAYDEAELLLKKLKTDTRIHKIEREKFGNYYQDIKNLKHILRDLPPPPTSTPTLPRTRAIYFDLNDTLLQIFTGDTVREYEKIFTELKNEGYIIGFCCQETNKTSTQLEPAFRKFLQTFGMFIDHNAIIPPRKTADNLPSYLTDNCNFHKISPKCTIVVSLSMHQLYGAQLKGFNCIAFLGVNDQLRSATEFKQLLSTNMQRVQNNYAALPSQTQSNTPYFSPGPENLAVLSAQGEDEFLVPATSRFFPVKQSQSAAQDINPRTTKEARHEHG